MCHAVLAAAAAVVPIIPGLEPAPPPAAGRWDRIPLALRETGINDIAVGDGLVWIGTSNGLAVYDGDRVAYPAFEEAERTALIVNDILLLPGRRALIGTIKGSIWLADTTRIKKLIDLDDRNQFRFARLHDGTIAVANSFGRATREQLAALDSVLPRWKLLPEATEHLAVYREWVFLGSNAGGVYLWNSSTPESPPHPIADLGLPNGTFVRDLYVSRDGTLYIASDGGTFQLVPTGSGPQLTQLFASASRAVYRDPRGGVWIAADDGLHRLHGAHYRWTSRDGLGSDFVSFVTGDDAGNLWVGDALGLLRHYDYFEPVTLAAEPASIIADGHGGVVAGTADGGAAYVDANGNTTALDVGPLRAASGYYRGTLVGAGSPGNVWILNHNGLFLYRSGRIERRGDYPPVDIESQPICSFAVSPRDEVVAGQLWTPAIHQWSPSGWHVIHETERDSGGSAISDLTFDAAGRLWAMTTSRLLVADAGKWFESEPFERAPDAKGSLFGAMTYRDDTREILASGAWGYPVRARFDGARIHAEPGRVSPGTPYLFRRVVRHPTWGVLAATDSGLWRFKGQQWERFSAGDVRLASAIDDIEIAGTTSFWVIANGLWKVTFPDLPPAIIIEQAPAATVADTSATISMRAVGLSGPPELRRVSVAFDPAVPTYGAATLSERTEYLLTGLRDGATYSFDVHAENAFGRSSTRTRRSFTVRLPWYRNALKLALAIALAIALLAALITRRGPMGILLRVLGGRRWRLTRSDPDLQIEIDRPDERSLSFRLQAPRRRTTVVPWVESRVEPAQLDAIRTSVRSLGAERPAGGELYTRLQSQIIALGDDVYALLPDAVKFAFEQTDDGVVQLLVASHVLDIPWELWAPRGRPAAVEHAIGRLVSSDTLVSSASDAPPRLRAAVLAPAGSGVPLHHAQTETRVVARALRSWGAQVDILDPASGCDAVLRSLRSVHFFHYAGHAHFDAQQPRASYLPLGSGESLSAEILESALGDSLPLFLIFVNGCGSGSETAWSGGQSVFGLASPFLRRSAYFIGAQWPVQDAFSLELAERFYRALFPPGQSLWWRWLRGRELAGASIGQALRTARSGLAGRPFASPTWPAYVYYGDPSAQLRLE